MSRKKFWIIGVVLAAAGVILARVVARLFNQPVAQLALFGAGVVIALAGVGLVMYGIKKGAEGRSIQ